jgi:carboxyl-terminal processing protease
MNWKQGNGRWRGVLTPCAVLIAASLFGVLYGPRHGTASADVNDLAKSMRAFTQTLTAVQQNYAKPVDLEKSVYDGAIPTMLHSLDPHSYFFDPTQNETVKEEQVARYYGVGMGINQEGDKVVVITPFTNSPAAAAGLRPGDQLLEVNGTDCTTLTSLEVSKLLRGPQGTPVDIKVKREGWDQPIAVHVVRTEVPRPAVDLAAEPRPGIGYVRVSTFLDENLDAEFDRALHELNFSHLDGFVLDLRNNGGGLVSQAVGLADRFLDKGEVIVSQRGRMVPEQRFTAIKGNHGAYIPLVIMVNGGSASASEIVAAAVQDHDRGLVAGETSFGKGLVQTMFSLSDATALWLTTAKYYTPSGRLIQRDYKTTSLFNYLYNPTVPKNGEVKLTDTGRQVRSGGGIDPDIVVDAVKYNKFQQELRARLIVYPSPEGVGKFTRHFLAARPSVKETFVADNAVMAQFQKYLDDQKVPYAPDDLASNRAWIATRIRREVNTAMFGEAVGKRIDLEDDAQLTRAMDAMPQAQALYANARKVIAQRQGARGGAGGSM